MFVIFNPFPLLVLFFPLSLGGLSFPKVGTDGTGHRLMEKHGHTLGKGIYPALTPLVAEHPAGKNLAGVSLYSVALECVDADRKKGKKKRSTEAMRTGLLFTHRGRLLKTLASSVLLCPVLSIGEGQGGLLRRR